MVENPVHTKQVGMWRIYLRITFKEYILRKKDQEKTSPVVENLFSLNNIKIIKLFQNINTTNILKLEKQ